MGWVLFSVVPVFCNMSFFILLIASVCNTKREAVQCRGGSNTTGILPKKKTMWFIGVEVEQETSAPPPKKNPGSAPAVFCHRGKST